MYMYRTCVMNTVQHPIVLQSLKKNNNFIQFLFKHCTSHLKVNQINSNSKTFFLLIRFLKLYFTPASFFVIKRFFPVFLYYKIIWLFLYRIGKEIYFSGLVYLQICLSSDIQWAAENNGNLI